MTSFSFAGNVYQADRIIGDLTGTNEGPTIVFVGGIHGNEPSGVVALLEVFRQLAVAKTQIHGRILAVLGNREALAQNTRFIDIDLNRIWSEERIASLGNGVEDLTEAAEMSELYSIFQPVIRSEKKSIFIDLHTTSAATVPFIAMNDSPENREFAGKFAIPKIVGIDEFIEGPLLGYVGQAGHVALAFEAGRHDDPRSAQIHQTFIYQSLVASGAIRKSQIPDPTMGVKFRAIEPGTDGSHAKSEVFKVTYRRPVANDEGFQMKPGFENLTPVKKGDVVAQNQKGEVRAPTDGLMFMPLYQTVGSDGYFLVQPAE